MLDGFFPQQKQLLSLPKQVLFCVHVLTSGLITRLLVHWGWFLSFFCWQRRHVPVEQAMFMATVKGQLLKKKMLATPFPSRFRPFRLVRSIKILSKIIWWLYYFVWTRLSSSIYIILYIYIYTIHTCLHDGISWSCGTCPSQKNLSWQKRGSNIIWFPFHETFGKRVRLC